MGLVCHDAPDYQVKVSYAVLPKKQLNRRLREAHFTANKDLTGFQNR